MTDNEKAKERAWEDYWRGPSSTTAMRQYDAVGYDDMKRAFLAGYAAATVPADAKITCDGVFHYSPTPEHCGHEGQPCPIVATVPADECEECPHKPHEMVCPEQSCNCVHQIKRYAKELSVPADEEVREAEKVCRGLMMRADLTDEESLAIETLRVAAASGDEWVSIEDRLPQGQPKDQYLVRHKSDGSFLVRELRQIIPEYFSHWKRIDGPKGDEQKEQK